MSPLPRNRNSVRNNPTPSAPESSTARVSEGSSILASRRMSTPSMVQAAAVLRRFSFSRSSSSCSLRIRYSSRICASGATINTPRAPSTISISPSRIMARALARPTMAGIAMLRARIAVCEVAPPTSVMKAAKRCSLNETVSAGDRSCATMTQPSSAMSRAFRRETRPGRPRSSLMMRSPTCNTSYLRSFR